MKQPLIYDPATISTILAQVNGEGPLWLALFLLLANNGLRVTEALNLTWQDVDFSQGELRVRTLKQKKPTQDVAPLNATVLEALQGVRNGQDPTARIFHWSRVTVWRVFQRLQDRAGVPRKKLHILRHSFVSRIISETGDLILARDLARHKSLETTNIYAHAIRLKEKYLSMKPIGAP